MAECSRSLKDLAEPVRLAAEAFVIACRSRGFEVLIYCTLRTLEQQAELYSIGRTKPGHIRTNARPGRSLHNADENGFSWAFDAVPLKSKVPAWGCKELLQLMGEVGESCGLEWAGRWDGSLQEKVHFQIRRSK